MEEYKENGDLIFEGVYLNRERNGKCEKGYFPKWQFPFWQIFFKNLIKNQINNIF